MATIEAEARPRHDGEMRQRIHQHDWSATPLGPRQAWPAALRILLDTLLGAPMPMCIFWGDEAVQLYNDAHAKLIGSRHPDALGLPARHTWEAIWTMLEPACVAARKGETKSLVTSPGQDDSMSASRLRIVLSPIHDEQSAIPGALLSLSEATPAAAEHSEAHVRNIADALPVLIGYLDRQLRYRFNNRHYEQWFGYEQQCLQGKAVREVIGERAFAERSAEFEAVLSGKDVIFEAYMPHRDGSPRQALMHYLPDRDEQGQVKGIFVLAQDVTERWRAEQALRELNETLESRVQERTEALAEVYERLLEEMSSRQQAQEALRQAQKMEAVGQLTGGLAHDFNNMLTGIIGGLDLIQRYIRSNRHLETQRFIDAAMTSANRAAALTHRLLAFARRQPLNLKRVNLNTLIDSMRDLLTRTLGDHIQIDIQLQDDLWPANSDENQLESTLLNLVINARDAMGDGGTLRIATANVVLEREDAIGNLPAGHYVSLTVADNGCGMTAKVLAAVFEPFFTTKPIGQGTGLGLSMVYGFARQAGGHVQITSEPNVGTEVTLYLPMYLDSSAPAVATEVSSGSPTARHGETVLVVEDEPAVRLLVLDVLEMLGYQRLEAAEANEAVALLETDVRIDLLVTDVGLPGMNGRQLADIARQRRPGLSVLFMTGYAEQAVSSGFLEPGMDMITKPFSIDLLAKRIRAMLVLERQ